MQDFISKLQVEKRAGARPALVHGDRQLLFQVVDLCFSAFHCQPVVRLSGEDDVCHGHFTVSVEDFDAAFVDEDLERFYFAVGGGLCQCREVGAEVRFSALGAVHGESLGLGVVGHGDTLILAVGEGYHAVAAQLDVNAAGGRQIGLSLPGEGVEDLR